MNHKCVASVVVLALIFLPALPAAAESGAPGTPPPKLGCPGGEISLSYTEATSVLDVYRSLAKACGWNVQFDSKLRDLKVEVELDTVTPLEALDTVMHVAGHLYKVLEGNTLLVFEDTLQSRRHYEDVLVRTFYLENVEVRDMMTALRSLLGAQTVMANESLGSVTIRDTADRVAVAERLVLSQDRPRGEVAVDVELLRLDSAALRAFLKQREDAELLRLSAAELAEVKRTASPRSLADLQLSVLHGGKAHLSATDRVPLLLSASEESYQYQDVGLDLKIGAQIHPRHREVTLTLKLEVSRPAYDLAAAGGSQPVFKSRGVELSARLGDGETYLLTGLEAVDEPPQGAASAPVRSSLRDPFGALETATEVVLAITPRIVRGVDGAGEELWVGTETDLTLRGDSRAVSDVAGLLEEPR